MISPEQMRELYHRYGFDELATENKRILAFGYRSGYYSNADVLEIAPSGNELKQVLLGLQSLGYACTVQKPGSLGELELALFRGFFALEQSRKRLRGLYDEYVTQVETSTATRYTFLPVDFEISIPVEGADKDIVSQLFGHVQRPGPKLILVEAAAGFGKTSSAYELIRRILDEFQDKLPLFTRLARHRLQRVFKYVLLDEIQQFFRGLDAEVVQAEIRTGRIPLVIDGFDELLLVGPGEKHVEFEDVEPMLATIAELLTGEAKVILTTRKTAVFQENGFETWVEDNKSRFDTIRVTIAPPDPSRWLQSERSDILKQAGFPLVRAANPVLFAYLRGLSEEDFAKVTATEGAVVEHYIRALLEREQERQALTLTVDEQRKILGLMAGNLLDHGVTAIERSQLRSLLRDRCLDILTAARERYSVQERPSLDELINKLLMHAMLDRVSSRRDHLAFVNDFLFGSLLGDWILAQPEPAVPAEFAERIVLAYASASATKRQEITKALQFFFEYYPPELQLRCDDQLRREVSRDYDGVSISDLTISNLTFSEYALTRSFVASCVFRNVTFDFESIADTIFSKCRFDGCAFTGAITDAPPQFYSCEGEPAPASDATAMELAANDDQASALDEFEIRVLEQFWPLGRPHMTLRKLVSTLYQGFQPGDRALVTRAIEGLRRMGLLEIKHRYADIARERRAEVCQILGRKESD